LWQGATRLEKIIFQSRRISLKKKINKNIENEYEDWGGAGLK
jgi:hypothetical protein